ncbi:amy [Symbiodinium natans]|uniref:alpha-amylase n=1 Tax=Symbiodinium natans TaxID=878477 RepID=A0A812TQ52_9DINO|nr:amy [Symbiodinium natans]
MGGIGGRQRRSPSYVKLWEWNYVDVARECQETLGPQGFDAVQLSPLTEHVTGHQWWVRYQPVSFGLNSRSGAASELRRAVAACRAGGVAVIADVVLNHMARPCHAAEAQTDGSTPCVGWNGTKYGNRQTQGAHGWDAAGPKDFHHQEGHVTWGTCGVGPETGFLCGSLVTTDCSCCQCDMYGLPDWNLTRPEVQQMQSRHLSELFDMGVTMLRVDAALYMESGPFAAIVHRFPWDLVYQEWWHELAVPGRTEVFGLYRDLHFMRKVADLLQLQGPNQAAEVVALSRGDYFIPPEEALYPTCFHDGRTDNADAGTPTYKNGLAFHQQQLFMLASPFPVSVLLWSGYSWKAIEQGPPGCESSDCLSQGGLC